MWATRQFKSQMWILIFGALFGGISVPAQFICPMDKVHDDGPPHFYFSIGTVTMPVGAFLLVRRDGQIAAIRLISSAPAPTRYEGKSEYESFFLPDKSTSFKGGNAEHKVGEIDIGSTVGVHAVFVYTKGHNLALIGKWKFHFGYPDSMDMSQFDFWKGMHDEGFEFAPTSACQLSEIDATDKSLRWFRWDRTTQITMPLAGLPK